MKQPKVSVIVTTKNESKNIARCLKSIKDQLYSNIEIIVVDNSSRDDTVQIAKEYTPCIFTKGPERSAQRNFGAQKATGEYLLFLDADMELTPHIVKECVEVAQNNKKIGGLYIAERPIGNNFWEKVKAFERSLYNISGDVTTDAARFFPRDVFENVGGYDETITGPEDWDLTQSIRKKGFSILWVSALINHYEYIPSLFSVFKKKYYYAERAHRYLKKQHVSVASSQTIYFLRPVFYKNWKEYFKHPILFGGMLVLLTGELCAGGLGYFLGRNKNL